MTWSAPFTNKKIKISNSLNSLNNFENEKNQILTSTIQKIEENSNYWDQGKCSFNYTKKITKTKKQKGKHLWKCFINHQFLSFKENLQTKSSF